MSFRTLFVEEYASARTCDHDQVLAIYHGWLGRTHGRPEMHFDLHVFLVSDYANARAFCSVSLHNRHRND